MTCIHDNMMKWEWIKN